MHRPPNPQRRKRPRRLLLSRYCGQSEVVFGTTVSGRPADLPGVESMVCMFINTIPIFGTLLSIVLIGETLQTFHIIAMALVLGGIAVAERGRPRRAESVKTG